MTDHKLMIAPLNVSDTWPRRWWCICGTLLSEQCFGVPLQVEFAQHIFNQNRWDKVWASVGPSPHEEGMIRFYIQAEHRGRYAFSEQNIEITEYNTFPPEAHNWLLDTMVDIVQEYLDGTRTR